MALRPKLRPPPKLPAHAATEAERIQLEQDWARYREAKAHQAKMDKAAATAAKARNQQTGREQENEDQLEAIRKRLEAQKAKDSSMLQPEDPAALALRRRKARARRV